MEVDVTEKFKYLVKYGLVSVLALAALVAGGLWYYQNQQTTLRIYDARVNSTIVGVKALAGGKLGELAVSDGEHVEAVQLIARVEVSVTEEQIRQLEQTVELAKQNLAQVRQGQTHGADTRRKFLRKRGRAGRCGACTGAHESDAGIV